VKRLFGASITAADGQAPVWHEDVRYFQIADETGDAIAYFIWIPTVAQRRGGAWMDIAWVVPKSLMKVARPPSKAGGVFGVQPTPPCRWQASLMTFNEVETLFHEFGHGLHHMLTRVDYRGGRYQQCRVGRGGTTQPVHGKLVLSSRNVAGYGGHYETGEPMPDIIAKSCWLHAII